MKSTTTTRFFGVVMSIASIVSNHLPAQASPDTEIKIKLKCVNQNDSLVTVAEVRKGTISKMSEPLMNWQNYNHWQKYNSPYISTEVSTKAKCHDVTDRLNNVMTKNGGTLNGISFVASLAEIKPRPNRLYPSAVPAILCAVPSETLVMYREYCETNSQNILSKEIATYFDAIDYLGALFEPHDIFGRVSKLVSESSYDGNEIQQVIDKTIKELQDNESRESNEFIDCKGNTTNFRRNELPANPPLDANEIEDIARQITVRIFTVAPEYYAQKDRAASGIIIHNRGDRYWVITSKHVFSYDKSGRYELLTSDGQRHSSRRISIADFDKLDLAIVEFRSPRSYKVASINPRTVQAGEDVYLAGYPRTRKTFPIDTALMSDLEKAKQIFTIKPGKIQLVLSEKSMVDGYNIGYTDESLNGMSGGPLLNDQGQLIAINGRSSLNVMGIETFKFDDGTYPETALFRAMEPNSWGISAQEACNIQLTFTNEVDNVQK